MVILFLVCRRVIAANAEHDVYAKRNMIVSRLINVASHVKRIQKSTRTFKYAEGYYQRHTFNEKNYIINLRKAHAQLLTCNAMEKRRKKVEYFHEIYDVTK